MQARRPAVWIVLLLVLGATVAGAHLLGPSVVPAGAARQYAGLLALGVQALAPAAFGCMLADRILRERRLRVDEVMASLPVSPGAALLGKYLGTAAATMLPILAVYGAGAVYLAWGHGSGVLPWAVAAFPLINLPGLLFVAAFSLGVPLVMPVALYQFLFVGYWFWGNLLSPTTGIPTISETILTPIGRNAAALFGAGGPAAASTAWASIGVLVAGAALALWATAAMRARGRRRPATATVAPTRPSRAPLARASLPRWAPRLWFELRLLGPSVLATPLVIVAVFDFFALLARIIGAPGSVIPRVMTAGLEVGLSLGAGIAAANLVASEPAAELHLSLPRGYRAVALTRLAIATACTCVLGFVLTGVMGATGTLLSDEPLGLSPLVWAAPVLWFTAMGALMALIIRSRAGSVGLVTGVWLVEFLFHDLFRGKVWLRPIELFATTFARGAPWWLSNRIELLVTAAVLFPLGWRAAGQRRSVRGQPARMRRRTGGGTMDRAPAGPSRSGGAVAMEIRLRGVTKVYPGGVQALGGVDLTIPSGMFGLLGPNGAGKTTLMRILAGILPASDGSIDVWGHDGMTDAGRLAVKRTLGYLPQDLGLYPDLSAREFLDYIALLKGLGDGAARRGRVAELLEMVSLSEVGDRRLKGFSGGMKRRVGIAQALLGDPRLLIVDEPTAGLDPEERIRFRNLLAELAGDRTVLLSTHIVEDVAQTCRRVAVMAGGRVRFQGTAQELVEAARGRVWTVETSGPRPEGDVTVVSMVHSGTGVRYRVVGAPGAGGRAAEGTLAEPTLEDGYVWLMRETRGEAELVEVRA